ncbi:MAG: cytochrome c biogenesis protein CcdA [Candidatus Bipolaricaulota bacterium]
MRGRAWCLGLLVLGLAVTFGWAQNPSDVVQLSLEHDEIELPAGGTAEITVLVDVTPGWHVNAHEPTLPTLIPTELALEGPPGVRLLEVEYPEPYYEHFGFAGQELAVYEDEFPLVARIAADDEAAGTGDIVFRLNYQACDNEVCLPPASAEATAALRIGPPAREVDDRRPPADPLAENTVARLVGERGMLLALAVVFVLGLGLNLTPCVYPMIPITVGYFGQQAGGQGRRTVLMALFYQLGIVITYSALGTAAALTGRLLGAVLQSPAVLAGVAGVMVLLALSLLGLYQIRPPAALTRAITGRARSGVPGALAMGLVAGVVAAPCVAPVSAALLAYVGATGNPWVGLSMFGALSLGLGVPYVGLALLSGRLKRLPQGGMWTVWVERLLGVVLLGVALYFLSPILPGQVARWGGAALALAGGGYLGWLAVRGRTGWALSALRMSAFGGGIAAAVLLLLPAGAGGGLAWEPYSPAAVQEAQEPVLLYFYADWCAPCREMSHTTFRNEQVLAAAGEVALVRVDLTHGGDSDAEEFTRRHGVWGVPTFVLLDGSGEELSRAEGYQGATAFLALLEGADTE